MRARLIEALPRFLNRHPLARRLVHRSVHTVSLVTARVPVLQARLEQVVGPAAAYARWVALYDTFRDGERAAAEAFDRSLRRRPRFSLVVAAQDPSASPAAEAIESIRAQIYEDWELLVADDASAAAANRALQRCSGDFVGLLDAEDVLAPHALLTVAHELAAAPEAVLVYTDHDLLDAAGARRAPCFKPDWSPALLRAANYLSRLTLVRRDRLEELGGLREELEGAHEWDLLLRATDGMPPERIRHVPHVLCHRRSEDDRAMPEPAARAVEAALARAGAAGTVEAGPSGAPRVRYALPERTPSVDVVVPTTGRPELVGPCLDGLLRATAYEELAVTVAVGRGALDVPERARLLERAGADPRVRVFAYEEDGAFNYSRVNNRALEGADAPLVLFLNDDVRVIHDDWLERMVGHVLQGGVAAVGALLYYPDETIQHGGVVVGLGGVAGHAHHALPRGAAGYCGRARLDQDVSCVTAGCMLVRRDVFDAVGGFDERLAIAYNDVDLCLRIREAGWRIVWTPSAELYHHESVSVGQPGSRARREQFERERRLMLARWGDRLERDPSYNPNLSLELPFRVAFPPRVDYPWRRTAPVQASASG